jgi:hypothetical protein
MSGGAIRSTHRVQGGTDRWSLGVYIHQGPGMHSVFHRSHVFHRFHSEFDAVVVPSFHRTSNEAFLR